MVSGSRGSPGGQVHQGRLVGCRREPFGYRVGEVSADGIVQGHLATNRHIGQQDSREHFGDRADLPAQGCRIGRVGDGAEGCDLDLIPIEYTHNDAGSLAQGGRERFVDVDHDRSRTLPQRVGRLDRERNHAAGMNRAGSDVVGQILSRPSPA